jgi:hypothetical protein
VRRVERVVQVLQPHAVRLRRPSARPVSPNGVGERTHYTRC